MPVSSRSSRSAPSYGRFALQDRAARPGLKLAGVSPGFAEVPLHDQIVAVHVLHQHVGHDVVEAPRGFRFRAQAFARPSARRAGMRPKAPACVLASFLVISGAIVLYIGEAAVVTTLGSGQEYPRPFSGHIQRDSVRLVNIVINIVYNMCIWIALSH